jgi:hypothetical protein
LISLIAALALFPACSSKGASGGDGGADADSDTDTDTDTDTDVDDCFDGDYTIDGEISATLFEPYPCILGDLRFVGLAAGMVIDLPNLEWVDGYLEVDSCSSLAGLSLPELTEARALFLYTNSFESIEGFDALETVELDIRVEWNSDLTSLAGLADVTQARGLAVSENPALEDLALSSIETLMGGLDVRDNDSLTSLQGLESLTQLGDTEVMGTASGGLQVRDNDALVTLEGIGGVTAIGGSLEISNNPSLESLEQLSAMTEVRWAIEVSGSPLLTDLTGLNNVEAVGMADWDYGGGITISDCDGLTDLTGLDGVAEFQGSLYVADNASLTSLAGIGGIGFDDVIIDVSIVGNGALATLAGLEGLAEPWSVSITDNESLTSLTGLYATGTVGGIRVEGNPMLTDLDAFTGVYLVYEDLVRERLVDRSVGARRPDDRRGATGGDGELQPGELCRPGFADRSARALDPRQRLAGQPERARQPDNGQRSARYHQQPVAAHLRSRRPPARPRSVPQRDLHPAQPGRHLLGRALGLLSDSRARDQKANRDSSAPAPARAHALRLHQAGRRRVVPQGRPSALRRRDRCLSR